MGAWFSNQIWNTSLIWLLGLFFIGAGFYFTTSNKLTELDKSLNDIQISVKEQKTALIDSKRVDNTEREKARDAFLADSKATAAGIAELNKQTAILGTNLMGVQKELEKIGQKLDTAPSIRR